MAVVNKLRSLVNGYPETIDLLDVAFVLEMQQAQINAVTASKPAKFDANKRFTSGDIDLTSEVTGTLPVNKGGTNSATTLNNNRVMQSSGGAIVEASAITANRALISDSNGIPTHSSVTNTELGYLSGVTSGIQSQLNALSSGFMRRKKVDDIVVDPSTTYPGTGLPASALGQRYIVEAAVSANEVNWGGNNDAFSADDIIEYNGTKWVVSVSPVEGMVVYVDDVNQDALFVDDGSPAWELRITAVNDHNDLLNIGTNTHAQIDSHIADTTIHFEMLDQDDMASNSDTKTATQQSIKAYVDSQVASAKPVTFQAIAGESFSANTTYLVRRALTGEGAGKVYKATSDHTNAPYKFLAIGYIQPTSAVSADDTVTVIKFQAGLKLLSNDPNFAAAADDGKPLYLNKDGAFSIDYKAGITGGEKCSVNIVGVQDKYNATNTLSEFTADCSLNGIGIDIA